MQLVGAACGKVVDSLGVAPVANGGAAVTMGDKATKKLDLTQVGWEVRGDRVLMFRNLRLLRRPPGAPKYVHELVDESADGE